MSVSWTLVSAILTFLTSMIILREKKKRKDKQMVHYKEMVILKNKYEKSRFVHKLKSKKEFSALEQTLKKLTQIELTLPLLVQDVEMVSPDQSATERAQDKVNKLKGAYIEFSGTFLKNKRFYPPNIYEKLNAIDKIVGHDILLFNRLHAERTPGMFGFHDETIRKKLEKDSKSCLELSRDVCNLIRERLENFQ